MISILKVKEQPWMEPNTWSGKSSHCRWKNQSGFTLLELMIVIVILGILVTLAQPSFKTATIKAREAVLKEDLFILRDVTDQYYIDNGTYHASLRDLTGKGYLRSIPVDPFTRSADTWVEVLSKDEGETSGINDVHSGSDLVGLNGIPYNEW